MIIRGRRIAAAAACLVLLSACDENRGPGPDQTPTPPTTTAGSSVPPVAKAPAVTDPLDAGAFVAAPCQSLTDAQRKNFALDEGEPDDDPAAKGQGCKWDNDDAQVAVFVVYNPELKNGLSHLYAQQEAGFYADGVWEPTSVDGYPAVIAMPLDSRKDGTCDLSVGISDTLFFRASVLGNPGDDSCVAAENFASDVLATIKAGG